MDKPSRLEESELIDKIRDWFRSLLRQAPASDPRRTKECMSITEVVAYARDGIVSNSDRVRHISSCNYCQSAIAIAKRIIEEQCLQARISDEAKTWSEAIRQRLREWVMQQPAESDALARFDDQGLFHINWSNLPKDGTVKIFLLWGDIPLPIGEGVVRNGSLVFSRPLPHFGLKGISIPKSLLRLEWKSEANSQQSTTPPYLEWEAKPNHVKEGDK